MDADMWFGVVCEAVEGVEGEGTGVVEGAEW